MKLAQTAKVPFWPILKPISEGCRGWRPDKHAKWKLVFWDLLAGCWDESEKRAKSNTCHQLESWWLATHGSIMTRHSRFNNRTVERKSVLLLWPSKRRDKDLQPPKKGCKWKWTKRRTYKCTSPNSSTTRKYLAKKKKWSVNSDPLLSIHCSCRYSKNIYQNLICFHGHLKRTTNSSVENCYSQFSILTHHGWICFQTRGSAERIL